MPYPKSESLFVTDVRSGVKNCPRLGKRYCEPKAGGSILISM